MTSIRTSRLARLGAIALIVLMWGAHSVHAGPVVSTTDLKTYWNFDGGLNDSAGAYLGNASAADDNLAPFLGAAHFVPGVFGQGLAVNHDVDAVSLDDARRYQTAGSADSTLPASYTIEGWVYPTELNAWGRLVLNWGGGFGESYHFALQNGNQVSLFHKQSNGATPNTQGGAMVLRQWQHVAGVADGSALRVYRNGVQVASAPYDGTIFTNSNAPLGVAERPNGNDGQALNFGGFMDEFGVWGRALSPAEIMSQYNAGAAALGAPPVSPNPAGGLISYWNFDGHTNDVAHQYANNAGTVHDDLTPRGGGANFVAGKVGQALRVGMEVGDLTDLAAPNSADVRLPAAYAIEAWINPSDNTGGWQRLVLNWGGGEFAYHFAIRELSGQQTVSLFHGEADLAQPNANGGNVILNTWQHIAAVADGNALNVYLNGELVDTRLYDGTIATAAIEGLGVGDSNTSLSTIKFNGLLDELAIWGVPLTPAQVRSHYQNGVDGYGLTPVPEPTSLALCLGGFLGLLGIRRRARPAT